MHYPPGGGGWLATSSGDFKAETLDRVPVLSLCGERKTTSLRLPLRPSLTPSRPEAETGTEEPLTTDSAPPAIHGSSTPHLPAPGSGRTLGAASTELDEVQRALVFTTKSSGEAAQVEGSPFIQTSRASDETTAALLGR